MSGYDERLVPRTQRPQMTRRAAVAPGRNRQATEAREGQDATAPNDDAMPAAEPETADGDELAAVVAERDRYLDQLQRTAAEYANYRRRTETERAQQRLIANETLLREIVPVLDDLQRGLNALPPDEQESQLAEGIRAVEQKFLATLKKHGVTPIEALGQPFDPAVHEAVEMDPAGGNAVVSVYAPGYRLGEGVLRPAIVKVGTTESNTESTVKSR